MALFALGALNNIISTYTIKVNTTRYLVRSQKQSELSMQLAADQDRFIICIVVTINLLVYAK